ncbi:hypothetical protein EVAR_71338_1 [Eumeta japonica]|uniref:Uncharacterized protein n=1 Tax=Eumeta variegata TaxID=151549 RepID=A0A4C2ACH7_EUMVA|nr:hypothetical protein EVAR_71338_1 [Eumeta japonica]
MPNIWQNKQPHKQTVTAYDRYPKLGNMQIFPMTTVNNEINIQSPSKALLSLSSANVQSSETNENNGNITLDEKEHLDDMLKICSEYTDRQNQNSSNCGSMSSSPIVQNRIKTNGSLPRDKKSPFQHETTFEGSFTNLAINKTDTPASLSYSCGYENVRLVGQNRVELNGQLVSCPKSGYENVVIGIMCHNLHVPKYAQIVCRPKEQSFASMLPSIKAEPQILKTSNKIQQQQYDDLLKTFGEKLQQKCKKLRKVVAISHPNPVAQPHKQGIIKT